MVPRARSAWFALVVVAMFLALGSAQGVAGAQTVDPSVGPAPLDATASEGVATPSPPDDPGVGTEPGATTSPPGEADEDPGDEPSDGQEQESEAEPVPSEEASPGDGASVDRGSGVSPSLRRSSIPVGTIVLAVGVLLAAGTAAFVIGRRSGRPGAGTSTGTADRAPAPGATTPAPVSPPEERRARSGRGAAADREAVAFLLELGEALVDAGDAVNRVEDTLQRIARRAGLARVGVIVLPTAIIISVPGHDTVQTEVTTAGAGRLRLDQTEAVLRLVDRAVAGEVDPAVGRAELADVRAAPSPIRLPLSLVGHAVAAVGLALIMQGNLLEIALAGALGAAVGVLQVVQSPRRSQFHPFLPLIAAFSVATAVFLVARVAPDLAILPPLVAPLIPFLPGALLTMGTLELATGQAVSGVARLGSGGLQLVLLAGGILGAAQFVGIPAANDVVADTAVTGWGGALGVVAPWVGVVVFGLGITWGRSARRSAVPWILLTLAVAYAGQVVGGLFFGNAASAFFGAVAMTPVAVYASRQPSGPPSLVTFLPAFWLLVPGALGLEGVTRILSEGGVRGISTLFTTGAAMVGIALGILLGLLVTTPELWRGHRPGRTSPPHA
ncbi:threonine/serine exporter family protein [Salsipaludibacter albus]|uniref:threonine/serine exporter family protein n=1 Tax=Salsipaludibacter albus TaxID=2849650 RepID=UPI001EE3A2FB|nr:threonine/serine exporter family protein [Salsipaludibacter albus]